MVLSALRRRAAVAGFFALLAAAPVWAQTEPSTQQVIARTSLRITQLESEIRRLTGQNEELAHRLRLLQAEFEKLKSDQELRLQALEGRGKAPAEGAVAAVPPPAAAPPPPAAPAAPLPDADKGARVLGTLRAPAGQAPAAVAAPAAPAEKPEQQYERAHNLIIKQRDFAQAEKVLRAFIAANPNHALAANAHYWLGRTFFVREDYENAAFAFAEGFQKFPKSDKAPANLLNLGMALSRLGKNREACTTYTRLLKNYASADDSVKRRVARERERANCLQR